MTDQQYQDLLAALTTTNNRLANLETGVENLQEQLEEGVERFEQATRDMIAEREEL